LCYHGGSVPRAFVTGISKLETGGRPARKIFNYSSFLEAAMNDKENKTAIRWSRIAGSLGLILLVLACSTSRVATQVTPATPTSTESASLRLSGNTIEMQDEDGAWGPVTGESTFEIVGQLEGNDPWMVTGNTFATRESTQIDEGLQAGDLVRVKGVILEDGTWLAYSIERLGAEGQTNPTIVLVGKVTSIDPWVVSEIPLNVTSDTLLSEGITLDMIVRVKILLLEDGTWEVLSIMPLGDFTDVPGCATVTANVIAVNGREIQLAGWPDITLGEDVKIEKEDGSEGTLNANQVVLVVVCAAEDGQIMITHIVILDPGNGEPPADGGDSGEEKVLICHKPDKNGGHTLSVSSSAVPAHLAHGDKLGSCP
jgi:hypothetical protein